jgi:uncharacterized protein (DUF305 family)
MNSRRAIFPKLKQYRKDEQTYHDLVDKTVDTNREGIEPMRRGLNVACIGLMALIVGGCTGAMPGDSMAGMDHSAMTTTTPMAEPMAEIDHSTMVSETQAISATAPISDTPMAGMDHSLHMDPDKPFDAQFIDGMIEHHLGAVVMAEEALVAAEQPELQALAAAIIAAQGPEIEQMTAWRDSWYPDLPPTGGMAMAMGDMAVSSDESKPYDQRFLEAMISHHQGAVEMALMAQQMAEQQEIKTLAAAIITAQQAEIAQMEAWLDAWFGGR